MNVNGLDDYREGIFWLLCGGGGAVMGLAGMDWLGIQRWYLYTLGVGLILVATIVAPRRTLAANRLRHGWLPIIIALVVSVGLAVASAEVAFVSTFPLVLGLLSMGVGLWLMLRPEPRSGGSAR